MDGILAQYIAVALHGSAWLADPDRDKLPALEEHNSTFAYVAEVSFTDEAGERVGVGPWLLDLAAAGVPEIGLATPDVDAEPTDGGPAWHLRAAFANDGISTGLVAATPSGTTLWKAQWHVGESAVAQWKTGEFAAARPWHVSYTGTPTEDPIVRPPLEAIRQELVSALTSAASFAGSHDMQPWDGVLEAAVDLGSVECPEPPYYPDMFPAGHDEPARRRLLAMATAGNVLGGQGTWNDVGFSDGDVQRDYDLQSRRLFAALMRAFRASVNSA